jgi:hypothetical protein
MKGSLLLSPKKSVQSGICPVKWQYSDMSDGHLHDIPVIGDVGIAIRSQSGEAEPM